MGIYIHRNLAKIGKTRIGYSKRLDGKNGCLSGCIQVLFLPFTILFSVVALIFGGKKKASSSGSARITPEPQKTTAPETTVPEETPEEKIEYNKNSMKTALVVTGVCAAVIILMLMIPTNDEPQDGPEPEEATAATVAETEPTRGVPVLELVTEAETEAEAKAETEPQTEAVTEKVTEAPKPKETEAPKPKETEAPKKQESKTEVKQEPKEEKKTERAVNATMYALYNVKARTTPADGSESIGTVYAGTAITVVSVDDATGWAKVKNGTGYIYILWQYLSKEKPQEPETEKAPQKEKPQEPETEKVPQKQEEKPQEPETEAPQKHEEEYKLALSVTSPVENNSMATLTAKGKPNTVYHISVYYSTKESEAQGLEDKTSDASGNVSWTWKVGGNTKPGKHKITVSAKNGKKDTATTEFETVK